MFSAFHHYYGQTSVGNQSHGRGSCLNDQTSKVFILKLWKQSSRIKFSMFKCIKRCGVDDEVVGLDLRFCSFLSSVLFHAFQLLEWRLDAILDTNQLAITSLNPLLSFPFLKHGLIPGWTIPFLNLIFLKLPENLVNFSLVKKHSRRASRGLTFRSMIQSNSLWALGVSCLCLLNVCVFFISSAVLIIK